MFKVGFAKIDLAPALRPVMPISPERIEAISSYFEYYDKRAIWIVFDFMDFNRLFTDTIRRGIAKATTLCEDQIHILTTHNHGGGSPDLTILSSLACNVALESIKAAEESNVRIAVTKCQKQINIVRRLFVPEINGIATLFYGASEKNGFNSSLFRENVIKNVAENRECNYMGTSTTYEKSPFQIADDEIVAIHFLNNKCETLGSIVRFAAHAVCSNRKGVFSSDYPYHIRRVMEERLGGISMFLNGLCGEIAPAIIDKYEGGEVRIGEHIAEAALNGLISSKIQKVESFKVAKTEVKLPVREELIHNKAPIFGYEPKTLEDRRKYVECERFRKMLPFLMEKYTAGEIDCSNTISVYLGLIKINDLIIAAFPGETFWSTGMRVKNVYPNIKICTVTEHERTVMYLPPLEDLEKGGYESVCKVTSDKGEEMLRESAISFIKDFLK